MLPEYYLYLVVGTEEYEIHRRDCIAMEKAVLKGRLLEKNRLGYASSKEEIYNKYKTVFPSRVINLPNCCK